jgi:formylmethanofuran dehydrogenase subunit B
MDALGRGARSGSDQVPHVTCLGCGCACDDIVLTVRAGRIVQAENACPLGAAWFGDGWVPGSVRVAGRECQLEEALDAAATLLRGARGKLLVFLGEDLTCAAQRAALGIADRLGALADGTVSETAAAGILAGQRRGRALATLGEIRNRADLVLYWGTDPDARYPRYRSRYAGVPSGFHLRRGRHNRTVVSVSIGADAGPAEADLNFPLAPEQEIPALAELRAQLLGRSLGSAAMLPAALADLTDWLVRAKYVAIVHDGEPSGERRSLDRTEGLIALAQALNGPTRAALSTLRGGGNRTGVEAVMTWQTGFPFAVDFSRGAPRYRPDRRAAELLAAGSLAAALIVGTPASLPEALRAGVGALPVVAVGPRASEAPFGVQVAIDTGVAGIHETGLGYRMDEIPLPLRAAVPGPRSATETLHRLADRLAAPLTQARS